MKATLFIAFLILALSATAFAQSQFARAVGGTRWDEGWSVVQTSDGGFAVAGGYDYDYVTYKGDLFLAKFTSTGSLEWFRAVEEICDLSPNPHIVLSVVQMSDGGFAVAANFAFPNLLKFNSTGILEWAKIVYDTTTTFISLIGICSIIQTSDGGFAVTGNTYSFGTTGFDLLLAKFGSTGSVEWSRAVGGTGYDEGYSIVQTSDGGFAVAGVYDYDYYYDETGDLFLVKFDSEGNSCIGEEVLTIVIDLTDSVMVTDVSPTVTDIMPTVTDVSPTVTVVSPTVTEICTDDIIETVIKPAEFEISVSPNPFNSSCEISIACRGLINQTPTIEIFDLNGRCVSSLTLGPSPAERERDDSVSFSHSMGEGVPTESGRMREIVWTPDEKIPSGVYLIRATSGEQQITKRAILIR